MRRIFLGVALQCVGLTGCTSEADRIGGLSREDRSLGEIGKFLSAVSAGGEVLVYEGLPHPGFEREIYAAEVKRSEVVWFEGYPFYSTALPVPEVEKQRLTMVAERREGHMPHGLDKFCGGFHPDYAIIWKQSGQSSGSLICLGCHEWKNFTPAGRLYEDLDATSYDELRTILSSYVVQRPKSKTG